MTWSNKYALVGRAHRAAPAVNSPTDVTFTITDCKLYVPVVTLSANH